MQWPLHWPSSAERHESENTNWSNCIPCGLEAALSPHNASKGSGNWVSKAVKSLSVREFQQISNLSQSVAHYHQKEQQRDQDLRWHERN